MGCVTEINMRHTRVTTNDEVDIIVPIQRLLMDEQLAEHWVT